MEVIYRCKHTAKVYGPKEEEYAQQAQNEYCEICREYNRRVGIYPISDALLVALEGSEKQVKWAADLRHKEVTRFHDRLNHARDMSIQDKQIARDTFKSVVQVQISAKWWIDNRFDVWKLLAKEYEKAFAQHENN